MIRLLKNTKEIEHYDFTKKARRPSPLIFVAHLIAKIMLMGRKHKVTYIGKKPSKPCLVLANHSAFNDFYMLYEAFPTPRINYIVAIDAFYDISDYIMRSLGSIAKRKFISDLSLMKNMKYVVDKLKDTLVMYPEARYSLDGTTSYIPDSVGKCVKFLKVPVVILNLKGSYVSDPQWHKYKQNKMPMECTVEEIISKEETQTLSVEEINKRIKEHFVYDDWQYLKECGNILTYKERATNLNAILYKCPNCKTEFNMVGKGTTLTCKTCNKVWEMAENGELKGLDGVTEYSHIPNWFKWEKQEVHNEVFSKQYKLESDCEVYTLPSYKGFVYQGKGHLYQDYEKTVLTVNLYGEDKVITYLGTQLESVHVEYNYKDEGDFLDFSIPNDSVWLKVSSKDILTKVSLATEEIRDLAHTKL